MKKTTFHISKMDCPSEENMIRMKLQGLDFVRLEFDIPNRKLFVFHEGDPSPISSALNELKLGSSLLSTGQSETSLPQENEVNERKLLWIVLWINLLFFLVEMFSGIFSASMGLVADSLDMLADTIVYSLSLYAIGGALEKKKRIAKLSGYFQLILAVFGFAEVLRRFAGFETLPDFHIMIVVSFFALMGNAACLFILQKAKSNEAHMRASIIFTSNDVIVNLGIILAAALVFFTGSKYPDLIVGMIVFVIVGRGALRILRLAK